MGLVNVPKLREGIIVSVVIFQSDSSYSKVRDDPSTSDIHSVSIETI